MGTARPLDDRPRTEDAENVRRLRLATDRLVNQHSVVWRERSELRRASFDSDSLLLLRGGENSEMPGAGLRLPNHGDEVEQLRAGVRRVGRVWYVDYLQVLVKWHDGRSSSLRPGRDRFYVRNGPAE
jgi:hypothetical protein